MANQQQQYSDMQEEEQIKPRGSAPVSTEAPLSRTLSISRLNAHAPEFVPRSASSRYPSALSEGRGMHFYLAPPPSPVMHIFQPPSPPAFYHQQFLQTHAELELYGGGGYGEDSDVRDSDEADQILADESVEKDGLPDDITEIVTKQVEYYFSDANLASTWYLMSFISKDPEGYVPLPVIAGFRKIKSLVNDITLLAAALHSSSKLAVSEDGKKVKRLQPITNADIEELQSRIVVAINLPQDHQYHNLLKIFSNFGRVKTLRTCFRQTFNSKGSSGSRHEKIDSFLRNKLHTFVEFETNEDAEKAVAELNQRNRLRVCLLSTCIKSHDPAQCFEPSSHAAIEIGERRGQGRVHGIHIPPRAQYHPFIDMRAAARLSPGPRIPDGTKGFNMGRGKRTAEDAP